MVFESPLKIVIPFLSCMALLLYSGNVSAQIDSNARVTLSCSSVCAGDSLTVLHGSSLGTGTIVYQSFQNLCLSYNNSPLSYVGGDSLSFQNDTGWSSDGNFNISLEARFNVDTLNRLFRNLVIIKDSSYYSNYSYYHECDEPDAMNQLVLEFDSLPYEEFSGILSAHGTVELLYSFSASEECLIGHEDWQGWSMDSGVTEDSLYLEISSPNADVSHPSQINNAFHVVSNDGNEIYFAGMSENQPGIKIYDFLGRTIIVIPVPAGAEMIELPTASLSPGLYFARLGDQIAKFVVPPR